MKKVNDSKQLIGLHTLGGQGGNTPMRSSLVRLNINWKEFIERFLVPEIKWGVRRFLLHLPFGTLPGYMHFDSYIHAKDRNLTNLTEDFVVSMKKLIRGDYSKGEKIQVICYLGSLQLEIDFNFRGRRRMTPYRWIKRVLDSIEPVLEAGCDIAMDTLPLSKPWDPAYAVALLLKNLGIKVYGEGTEFGYVWNRRNDYRKQKIIYHDHFAGFNWTANHQHTWHNILDIKHGAWRNPKNHLWGQPDKMDEGVIMVGGHSMPKEFGSGPGDVFRTYHKWAPDMILRNFDFGYSSAIIIRYLIDDDMTMKQLLNYVQKNRRKAW